MGHFSSFWLQLLFCLAVFASSWWFSINISCFSTVFLQLSSCLSGWLGKQLGLALGFLFVFGMVCMLRFHKHFCSYFLLVAFYFVPWIWYLPGFYRGGASTIWAVMGSILRCLLGGMLFWICSLHFAAVILLSIIFLVVYSLFWRSSSMTSSFSFVILRSSLHPPGVVFL